MSGLVEGVHYYLDGGLLVFTARYHLERGHCCGSGCRHCPYDPPHVAGSRTARQDSDSRSP